MNCSLVPPLIYESEYNNDYGEYQNAVYQRYLETFSCKQFYYKGKPIREKRHPEISGMSGTFWHIISSGRDESEKLPDFKRYEAIAYPGFILDYCLNNCQTLLQWENLRKASKKRVLLFCPDIDYLVVLEDRSDYYLFWTAYPVTYPHRRKALMEEYRIYTNGA